jgi:hypothetical protein
MHVNPSSKFVSCLPILLCMQMETKDAHAWMGAGWRRPGWFGRVGAAGTGLIGWCRGGWGFHHMFRSPGIYIYI